MDTSCDVLVIGGGGAAAAAALEAAARGADVTLAVKGAFNAIGTRGAGATSGGYSPFGVFATPGWRGPLSLAEKDLPHMVSPAQEKAYMNIRQVGLGMADPALVRLLVEEAVATRKRLLELGATFGEFGLRSHGVPVMAALGPRLRRAGVRILQRFMVTDLIFDDSRCLGAAGVQEREGKTLVIGEADLRRVYEMVNCATSPDVDFVYLGCPHYNIEEIKKVAYLLEGQRCRARLWITTNPWTFKMAETMGLRLIIEQAGGNLLSGTCPGAINGEMPPGTVMATDAIKQNYYITGIVHPRPLEVWYGTTEDCVAAAVSGRWQGRWR